MAFMKPLHVYFKTDSNGISPPISRRAPASTKGNFPAYLDRAKSTNEAFFSRVSDKVGSNVTVPPSRWPAAEPFQVASPGTEAQSMAESPGLISARFESGASGSGAIGYDRSGGTSYGTFQIASRSGTMDRFISFLEKEAPEWAERLSQAGPADTGGKTGRMPTVWQEIAAEDPQLFEALQRKFIEETHYRPALERIRKETGIDVEKGSRAIQEVLWSLAVQHGPAGAARIFCEAAKSGSDRDQQTASGEEALIRRIYSARSKRFGSSSVRVRAAVAERFREEQAMALAWLRQERMNSITA
ncbi:MAG: hypothetical protein K6360_07385 [Deltaproteobacteria bacterium]